jgi:hypothetical protein
MQAAELARAAVNTFVAERNWREVRTNLANLSIILRDLNRLALCERYSMLGLRLAEALSDPEDTFRGRLNLFGFLASVGRWDQAEEMWNLLDPMGRDWRRNVYRPEPPSGIAWSFCCSPWGA